MAMEHRGLNRDNRDSRDNENKIQTLFRHLTSAIGSGDVATLEKILTKNRLHMNLETALNSFNAQGLAPIHEALIARKNIKIIELLLEYGADPNRGILEDFKSKGKGKKITLYKGWTAAHIATRYCDEDILWMLLKHDADFFVTDNSGWSPLQLAKSDRRSWDLALFFKKALQASINTEEKVSVMPEELILKIKETEIKVSEVSEVFKHELPKAPEEKILEKLEYAEPQVAKIIKLIQEPKVEATPVYKINQELEAGIDWNANRVWILAICIISFWWGFM